MFTKYGLEIKTSKVISDDRKATPKICTSRLVEKVVVACVYLK